MSGVGVIRSNLLSGRDFNCTQFLRLRSLRLASFPKPSESRWGNSQSEPNRNAKVRTFRQGSHLPPTKVELSEHGQLDRDIYRGVDIQLRARVEVQVLEVLQLSEAFGELGFQN